MKNWITNSLVLIISSLSGLLVLEVASRYLHPISVDVQRVSLDGKKIDSWLLPSSVYRQLSSEYDALTTITDRGYRAPAIRGNPELIFIGDSFTFGWGLADEDTFANLFCEAQQYVCANLGEPGTGTEQQVDRLETALSEWGWRPKEVKLFVFAMTASFSAGNDLADNYNYIRWKRGRSGNELSTTDGSMNASDEVVARSLLERLLDQRELFLSYSNLLRIAKYHLGPWLRSALVPRLDEDRLAEALDLTGKQLRRLDYLSKEFQFVYKIYLLHPVQDILKGTYTNTLLEIDRVSPIPVQDTADLFVPDPVRFYFAYDGHINRQGSRAIAEFLMTEK